MRVVKRGVPHEQLITRCFRQHSETSAGVLRLTWDTDLETWIKRQVKKTVVRSDQSDQQPRDLGMKI